MTHLPMSLALALGAAGCAGAVGTRIETGVSNGSPSASVQATAPGGSVRVFGDAYGLWIILDQRPIR